MRLSRDGYSVPAVKIAPLYGDRSPRRSVPQVLMRTAQQMPRRAVACCCIALAFVAAATLMPAPAKAAATAVAGLTAAAGGPGYTFERRELPSPSEIGDLTTEQLRSSFLVDRVFIPGEITMTATPLDRMVVGGAAPLGAPLSLQAASGPVVGKGAFLARRELAIYNTGPGAARIVADGVAYDLEPREALYVAAGTQDVTLASEDAQAPAKLFFVSAPCASRFQTAKVSLGDATAKKRGSPATSNERTLYQMVVPGKVETCQLMMGATFMANGSVWNTMPPHLHSRRTEVYLYFDLAPSDRVFHFMGAPKDTRHLVVSDRQAVLSPSWSIHGGAGTTNYAFVWVMAGENQDFDDMDVIPPAGLL